VLYLKFAAAGRTNLGIPDVRNMNLLIHHWFGAHSQNPVNSFSHCSIKQRDLRKKISLANFWFRTTLFGRA
jgi:hypothetical protein